MGEQACQTLHRALAIHKSHNGIHNYKAAQLFSQLATAYAKVGQIENTIENHEHACMILLKIEEIKKTNREQLA